MLCGLLLFDISVTWSWLVDCWLVILADVFLSLFSTGNRFCYLSLTALPVDYKALGKKKTKQNRTHPPQFLLNVFLWLLFCQFWGKDTWRNTCTWKAEKCFKSPSPRKTATSRFVSFGICSPATLRNVWSQGTSSAEPFQTPCGFIYMYSHIAFLYVTDCCIRVAASDHMWQVSLWTPGQAPPRRTKPVP